MSKFQESDAVSPFVVQRKRKRKFSFKKINLSGSSEFALEDKKFTQDPNIYFSREDKFLGKFKWKKGLIVTRKYLEHTPSTKIYHTQIHSKKVRQVAQIIIIHGWASSSNFIEVSKNPL
jgi:hypothetical protein